MWADSEWAELRRAWWWKKWKEELKWKRDYNKKIMREIFRRFFVIFEKMEDYKTDERVKFDGFKNQKKILNLLIIFKIKSIQILLIFSKKSIVKISIKEFLIKNAIKVAISRIFHGLSSLKTSFSSPHTHPMPISTLSVPLTCVHNYNLKIFPSAWPRDPFWINFNFNITKNLVKRVS